MNQMNEAELRTFIDQRLTRSAFRLELLDHYDTAGDVQRFLAGELEPSLERKQPRLDQLRRDAEAGVVNHRVHVLSRPLTDYLRYECEYEYRLNVAAGEAIWILDTTERLAPEGIANQDFWLIDDEHTVRIRYSAAGRFLYAEEVPEYYEWYRYTRDLAIDAAEPFDSWWTAHPEEWRQRCHEE